MKDTTKGAWLISHSNKIQNSTGAHAYEDIETAGKCGIFLSNLSSDNSEDINKNKIEAIAKISNIRKSEISYYTNLLKQEELIDTTPNGGISVIGVVPSSILGHTSKIFSGLTSDPIQLAAIDLANKVSDLPLQEKELKEYISDTYRLNTNKTGSLFTDSELIGFTDYESLSTGEKLYFNGHLFRRGNSNKVNGILSNLNVQERNSIALLDEEFQKAACIPLELGYTLLGETLFKKLQSIGMYDVNEVSNTKDSKSFVTKPAAFAKFGNPFEEDALDLAKAFVTSLFYGMTVSSHNRGKITMLEALLKKLIEGQSIGPATAIGEDYKLLEIRNVVKIIKDTSYKYPRFKMMLLKKEIGILALEVLQSGTVLNTTTHNATLVSGNISLYKGPEFNRNQIRIEQKKHVSPDLGNLISTLRDN